MRRNDQRNAKRGRLVGLERRVAARQVCTVKTRAASCESAPGPSVGHTRTTKVSGGQNSHRSRLPRQATARISAFKGGLPTAITHVYSIGVVQSPAEYDDELLKVHLQQAADALPGPDYYTVLHWIHEILRPVNYVEIGFRRGDSLRAALPDTRCVAVDPAPDLAEPLSSLTQVLSISSDTFFQRYDIPRLLGAPHFSLAFIDGLHLFEQALLDFVHLERLSSRKSIVMLHDCLPLDRVTSERARTTHFYSGDVWKLAMCLKVHRPDLRLVTIKTAPTGLCLVGHLDPDSDLLQRHYAEYVAEYVPLGFDYYRQHPQEMPANIPNTFTAVSSWINNLLQGAGSGGGPKP